MKLPSYPLIQIWGAMLGSSSGYISEQIAEAKNDRAPQTALYYRTRQQTTYEDRSGRGEYVKGDNVWQLLDEYLATDTRHRMNLLSQRKWAMTLTEVLASIGYEERDRTYADVHVDVSMNVDVPAWMTEYGVNREHALEQIRNDIVAAIKVAFMHDKWTGLVDDVETKLGMEA